VAERKYEKYIITEPKSPSPHYLKKKEEQRKSGSFTESVRMFSLDESIASGGFYVDCVWLVNKQGPNPVQTEIAHTHDFDEVLVFAGTVRDNPRELGGEIEFWLGDEQYIFTRSCLIFVPRNLSHLPLLFRKIDSPIFFLTAGNGTMYTRSSGQEE
jgi:hypothetical protein